MEAGRREHTERAMEVEGPPAHLEALVVLLQLLVTEAGSKLREGWGRLEAWHCLPAPTTEDLNLHASGPHPTPA